MKKLISVLLAVTLILSACALFAGCDKTPADTNTTVPADGTEDGTTVPASSGAEISTVTPGVLTVAMECAYAPYNWTQPTDANGAMPIKDSSDYAYGYDVMMAKLIATSLGLELQIVKLDWDSLITAVQTGVVDCVIAGQSITSDRLQAVDFTTPYYYASIVGLVKNDGPFAAATGISALAGAKCTSQLNTVWYDVCLPQIKDADIQTAQESAPTMLVALESGAVELVVTDMPTAKAACVAYNDFTLLDFSGNAADNFVVSEEEINIGISLKKGNAALLEGINGVLAGLTEDTFNQMMDEAISVQPLA